MWLTGWVTDLLSPRMREYDKPRQLKHSEIQPRAHRELETRRRNINAEGGRQFLNANATNRNVLRLGGPEAPEVLPGGRRRHKEQSAVLAKRAVLERQEKEFRAKHTRTDSSAPRARAPGEREVRRHHYD